MSDASASLAQHYHSRTKYDPETLSQKSQALDWAAQPVPFKTYQVGVDIDLKPYLDSETATGLDHADDWMRLSRLLINAYGLTAKFPTATGQMFYLRSSPSAGGFIRQSCTWCRGAPSFCPPGFTTTKPAPIASGATGMTTTGGRCNGPVSGIPP